LNRWAFSAVAGYDSLATGVNSRNLKIDASLRSGRTWTSPN
jgi:hypothetical protein